MSDALLRLHEAGPEGVRRRAAESAEMQPGRFGRGVVQ
jgi:hypothetical protein